MIPVRARVSLVLALTAAGIGGLVACRSMPTRTPLEVASDIARRLVSGDESGANEQFGANQTSEAHHETVFSIVYAQAGDRYDAGDFTTSTRLLGFLVRNYPRARAPREALVYATFLERTRLGKPSPPSTRRELLRHIASIREGDSQPPVWLDLVEAQVLIDGNSLALATPALARFGSRWEGDPPALRPYIEEMEAFVQARRDEKP